MLQLVGDSTCLLALNDDNMTTIGEVDKHAIATEGFQLRGFDVGAVTLYHPGGRFRVWGSHVTSVFLSEQ